MQVEFLGTGGALPPPRPLCRCRVCVEARERGAPYGRGGPSLFVHGPDLLIDTPEEIGVLLNRSKVRRVARCTYSHWHPDHTMGRRVFEALNSERRAMPPSARAVTDVYLPERVAADAQEWLGLDEHLGYLERIGLIRRHVIADGGSVQLGQARMTAFPLHDPQVYGFLLEQAGRRLLVVMDEMQGWWPPTGLGAVDLAVLPMGICEHDPFTGERRIDPRHPLLAVEASFERTLQVATALDARRVLLAHVEEPDGLSHDDLTRLSAKLALEGTAVEFAWDGLVVDV